MTSGRRLDPDLISAIRTAAAEAKGPSEILRDLEMSRPGRTDLPDIRTVQRYVREFRHGDVGDAWSLTSARSPGSEFVLAVLAEVVRRTKGRTVGITRRLASWVDSVHDAAPDLDPWTAYLVAHMYSSRAAQSLSAADLDHFLAFAPWRSDEAAAAYEAAVSIGWIDRAPVPLNWNSMVIIAAGSPGSKTMPVGMDPDIWDHFKRVRESGVTTPITEEGGQQ